MTTTTTITVNDDGTETVVITESLEVFLDDELTNSIETVISEETRPTDREFVGGEEDEEPEEEEPEEEEPEEEEPEEEKPEEEEAEEVEPEQESTE